MNDDKRLHLVTKHRQLENEDGDPYLGLPERTWVFPARKSARKFRARMNASSKKFVYLYGIAEQGPA